MQLFLDLYILLEQCVVDLEFKFLEQSYTQSSQVDMFPKTEISYREVVYCDGKAVTSLGGTGGILPQTKF